MSGRGQRTKMGGGHPGRPRTLVATQVLTSPVSSVVSFVRVRVSSRAHSSLRHHQRNDGGRRGINGNANTSNRSDPKRSVQSSKKRSFSDRDAGGADRDVGGGSADGVVPAAARNSSVRPSKRRRTFSWSIPSLLRFLSMSAPAAVSGFFSRILPFDTDADADATDTALTLSAGRAGDHKYHDEDGAGTRDETKHDEITAATTDEKEIPAEAEHNDIAAAEAVAAVAGIPREDEDDEIVAATAATGSLPSSAYSLCDFRKGASSTTTTACSTPATLDAADDDDDFPALDDDWGGDIQGDVADDADGGEIALPERAGRAVYAAAAASAFLKAYFDQEGIALSEEEFVNNIAPLFTRSFLSRAVSTDKSPACCITPDEFETFFHGNSRQPGSYSSVMFVHLNDLVKFRDDGFPFPAGFDEKYKPDLIEVIEKTINIAEAYHDDPSASNPLVGFIYNGLTAFNVVVNPDAEDDDEAKKGRMQQHLAGGSAQSLHSAGRALLIDSGLFVGCRHLYGVTAPTEHGDNVTAAGCEVFESAAFVGGGRRWTSKDGETLNKACVGLVSARGEDREGKLWEQVLRLRGLLGDDASLPGYLANIARGSVLKRYIIQTLGLSDDADPAAITLGELSSAITAHASAVRHGLELDADRAAALMASDIPREELLFALDHLTPTALNSLIQKHHVVGCRTFGRVAGFAYPRVKKLILEAFGEEVIREFKAKRESLKQRAQAAAKRKKEDEAAAIEAADRPKVLGIVAAAFRSVIAEVGTKTSSAYKIRHLTRDRAVDNLASREDLTWNGLYVWETAGTMATTFESTFVSVRYNSR